MINPISRPSVSEMADTVQEWLTDSSQENRDEFLKAEGNALYSYHSTLGMKIRNYFKLWDRPWEPEIGEDGVDYAEDHPDAISFEVIKEVWRRERDKHART